jgi:C-terminal four TMM region of protein-O-mannosyltransferase
VILLTLITASEDFQNRFGDVKPKDPKRLSFFTKFGELQLLMLQHNAGLTASHPYASSPINWPFLLSGISFWTQNQDQKQIYLIGNIIGWWTCIVALSIYLGIIGADLLARRRGVEPIPDRQCSKIHIIYLDCLMSLRSRTQSSLELNWFLRGRLGCALHTILSHESPAFHPPLPPVSSGFSPCGWSRFEFCVL